MSLQITFRPQKDLYVTNPPTAYDESYYTSRWVAAHLPVQYKISNTKYPLNSDDDVDGICSVSDVNGFAQLNLCGTYETYVKYEYIIIEDSSNTAYNGVWQILDVANSTTLTISAAYDGAATGTVQRYYNNYHNLVKVYAGIPSNHQYQSEDPMSLIATLKIIPNTNNISIADISGLIQSKVNCDNDRDQISIPNDLNAWTGFYIEYAESYDVSDGTEVSTFTSSYTTDDNENCETTNIITNGNFPTNLNGWVNGDAGIDWVWSSGKAEATKGAGVTTKVLYQETDFLEGVEYNVQITAVNSEANSAKIFLIVFDGTALTTATLIYSDFITGTQNISFTFTPARDYPVFGVRAVLQGTSAQIMSIDNISATVSDCTYYGYAINGTRQFQNTIGGNFGDYVQNFNNMVYDNKFLTLFERPVWFDSLYFDLSTIIPKSTFDSTENGELYYEINEYTEGGGFIQRQDVTLTSKDDGVYRLPISDLTLDSNTENFTVQIYQLPTNKITQGNGGTFEYTVDPSGNPPSDWGITKPGIITDLLQSTEEVYEGDYSLKAVFDITGFSQGENTIWQTNGGFTVQANSDYIVEGYVLNTDVFLNGSIYFLPVTAGTSYQVIESVSTFSPAEEWRYIKVIINTGVNTSLDIKAVFNNNNTFPTATILYFDSVTAKGPVETLSEIKTIRVDNNCSRQSIYLTWLNPLGGWEYFNFKAEKDYNVEISESQIIERDIYSNWDEGFINGETQGDYNNIRANESKVVRAQFITQEELDAVLRIKYAIRVQEIREDDTKVTVLVDKRSFKVRSDGDKLYTIEFEIAYPNIQIQTQ